MSHYEPTYLENRESGHDKIYSCALVQSKLIRIWGKRNSNWTTKVENNKDYSNLQRLVNQKKHKGYVPITDPYLIDKLNKTIFELTGTTPLAEQKTIKHFDNDEANDAFDKLNDLGQLQEINIAEKIAAFEVNGEFKYLNNYANIFDSFKEARQNKKLLNFAIGKYEIEDEYLVQCVSKAITRRGFDIDTEYVTSEVMNKELIVYNNFGELKLVNKEYFVKI